MSPFFVNKLYIGILDRIEQKLGFKDGDEKENATFKNLEGKWGAARAP